jgi:hypothetical protein
MSSHLKLRLPQALNVRLEHIVVLALIMPSLVWFALDRTVWFWDSAFYGKASVELFLTLVRSPSDWIQAMLSAQGAHAPGIAWIGQFFVPLGFLLGSVDDGLLLSTLMTQAVTLLLTYRFVSELSNRHQLVAVAGCLVTGSAPLFVGLSHQYFTEPLQLMAVAWFVLIMTFAPRWSRLFIVSQLLCASSVAMLAKVSSPLYCIGPALVGLWFVLRRTQAAHDAHERPQQRVVLSLAAGVFLSSLTAAWYQGNVGAVLQHARTAASGPISELYGGNDSFLNTMVFWLDSTQRTFFLPVSLVVFGLVLVVGICRYLLNSGSRNGHFSMCAGVSALQLLIVLSAFSSSSNREPRFLLPLLPYVACLISWSAAQGGGLLVSATVIITCLVQLAAVHGQALGVLRRNMQIPWLATADSNRRTAVTVSSIVAKTCADESVHRYWTIIGDQKAWLNEHTLGYTAAKELARFTQQHCDYDTLGYMGSDVDEAWERVLRAKPRYYITTDPVVYVVADDKLDRALNQLNAPVLREVETSGLFEAEPVLPEDPGVIIFKRMSDNRNDDAGAAAVATQSVDSIRGARFGQTFELLGSTLTPAASGGIDLKLAWRCLRETKLRYNVAVHFIDNTGNVLGQADFVQDPEQELVTPGAAWVDRVRLSRAKLMGARGVGIALYAAGSLEPIDRGPRDWDGHRLLLPLGLVSKEESETR